MACLVVRVQVDAGTTARIAEHCAAVLKRAVRFKDVIARLAPTDFAVVAPDTGAKGARDLAVRLVKGIDACFAEPDRSGVRIAIGYEVVANLASHPVGAEALLLRATTALRAGRADPEHRGIRRFGDAPASSGATQEQLVGA
jgi:GGDEF domain-containing protein